MQNSAIDPKAAFAPSELILREDGSVYHLGIRSEHIADTVIVVGDPDRVAIISDYFDEVDHKVSGREFTVHTGTLKGTRLTVLSTGIGVDNIDIVVNELDAAVNIDPETRRVNPELRKLRILRLGTSGSLHEEVRIGDYLGSAYAIGMEGVPFHYQARFEEDEVQMAAAFKVYTEWDPQLAHPYAVRSGSELKALFGDSVKHGITLTANGFYAPQGRALRLPLATPDYHDRIRGFRSQDFSLTNFEMECAGLYALGAMLGHDVFTVCVILADRGGKEFHPSPSTAITGLIEHALHRLTAV